MDEVLAELHNDLDKAQASDENDADIHRVLAAIHIARNDLDQAQLHQHKAHRLNPNYDLVVVQSGELLHLRPEESIELILQAMIQTFTPATVLGPLWRVLITLLNVTSRRYWRLDTLRARTSTARFSGRVSCLYRRPHTGEKRRCAEGNATKRDLPSII